MERGHTLVELALVLALVGLFTGIAAPAVKDARDAASVRAGLGEVAGALARARMLAVASGGAVVSLRREPASVTLTAPGRPVETALLGEGLVLGLPGGRSEIDFAFGPLGIGRMTSGTVRVRRGDVEGALVVSALGRVRRR